ncbi:DUF2975 domain-containing protein [Bacteroides sp.]|uniref:DUF2975 domain-containing protein n=1 Tax=Bacteroides sp. TaxID=29523 RepID=UPI003AB76D7F
MKKFRILGILAILVIVVESVFSFTAGWKDAKDSFMEGFNSVYTENHPYSAYQTVPVSVRPLANTQLDSLENSFSKENLPYKIDKIRVPIIPSIWSSVITFFAVFVGLALLAGFYCLIRLFISISKRDVFTDDNVVRMRVFTYSLVAFSLLDSLVTWLNYIEVTKQVALPGYEVAPFELAVNWLLLVVAILFTEIFAVGTKLKQEQDLTI